MRRRLGILLAAAVLAVSGTAAGIDAELASLKAAYLYNFVLYTDWPVLPATFELCIAGREAFGGALEQIEKREVAGRPLHVRAVTGLEVPAECHLLFIGAAEQPRLARLLQAAVRRPVVTVVDVGLPDNGQAMISLGIEQNRLGFSANLSLARAHGLGFSSKMLRIARDVR
jgi:hypothetical protein